MKEYIYGNDPKRILIVHGWMHSAKVYEDLALKLSADFSVHLVDLPGFGEAYSEAIEGENYIDALSCILEKYLKKNDFDLIMCHSLGGAVMLRILDRNKIYIRAKIILSNPAYQGIPIFSAISENIGQISALLAINKKLPPVMTNFPVKLIAMGTVNNYSRIDESLLYSARISDPNIAAKLFYELAHDNWRVTNTEIYNDITLLISENDLIISRQNMDLLKSHIFCEMVVIPSIGHTPVKENFEFLYEFIKKSVF